MTSVVPPHGGQPVVISGAPLGTGRVVVILVHGRNAAPQNILDLAPFLARTDVTFLAPAAHGGTWYPLGFMAPTAQNEPGITSGIAVVHALIEQAIATGIPSERIVLLGFSQGACLASTSALRRPARYGGVIVYSGGLIGPPGTEWTDEGTFGNTPVFCGCSDIDPHIPEVRVRETSAVFERMGAAITTRIYPGMGHLVNDDEIVFTRDLIAEIVASS